MLSKGDEYPIHQTPEPIAFSGTDRNFYDRYFFCGYRPDGAAISASASASTRTSMWPTRTFRCCATGPSTASTPRACLAWSGWTPLSGRSASR